MAPSPLRTITCKHARSISLPSRSHLFMPQFDEHLFKVRASEATAATMSSMSNRLADLNNLYDCTDDVLVLPHIQQAISHECQDKWAYALLDGYLRLLDACSTTRDLFSQTKQSVQELLSALRRKDIDGLSGYLASRRKSMKIIQKALKHLSMLKEVESITLIMFESFLSHFDRTKMPSRQSGWSLVSKLMNTISSNQDEETSANEFEKIDNLISYKLTNMDDMEQVKAVQNRLGNILSSIQTVEEELECLFRRLIKSRVFLLNILNH